MSFFSSWNKYEIFPSSDKYDFIDLFDKKIERSELKKRIYDFYHSDNYLSACGYCPGRGALIRGDQL